MTIIATLLILMTFGVFSRAIFCDFLYFDDDDYVTRNLHVQQGLTMPSIAWAFTTGEAANWHPMTWLSLMLDMRLAGMNPAMFHSTSVVLHALNAALLFLLLTRMTGSTSRSLIVAAIFAVHPLRVESVAWIAERKDVLSAFFGLLSLHAYVSFTRCQGAGRSSLFNALGLLLFALSLMAKPMLVTLPFVLLLLDYWPLKRSPLNMPSLAWRRLLIEKVPWLLLTIGSCVITYQVQHAGGAVSSLDGATRVANALVSFPRYLWSMIWPARLAIFYPMPDAWPVLTVAGAVLFLMVVTGIALWSFKSRPWIAVGWFWFVGVLIPMVGLIQVGKQSMADRYTYFPMIGILLAVVWSIPESWFIQPRWRTAIWTVTTGILILLCVATTIQIGVWRNSQTVFEHDLAVTSENATALGNIGFFFLMVQNDDAGALKYLKRAAEIDTSIPSTWANMGQILARSHRPDEAKRCYQRALEIDSRDVMSMVYLGSICLNEHDDSGARVYFERALSIDPERIPAILGLARVRRNAGDFKGAMALLDAALELQPTRSMTHYDRGVTLSQMKDFSGALAEFKEAVQLSQDFAQAHVRLGETLERLALPGSRDEWELAAKQDPKMWEPHLALAKKDLSEGKSQDAIRELQAGISASPRNVDLHIMLSNLLVREGRADDGINEARAALGVAPDDVDAHFNLATILMQRGRAQEAIVEYEAASKLNPSDQEIQDAIEQAKKLRDKKQ